MRTTADWIAAGDLTRAAAAVAWPDDWLALAAAHGDAPAASACLARAVERAAGEHWPARRAAEAYLARGDRPAAAAALATIEARLRAGGDPRLGVRGYQWRLLGEAYRAVLADGDAVARCVAAAAALARASGRPDDRCEEAAALTGLADDRAGARAALIAAEAAALALGQVRALWDVANAWSGALGDRAEGHAVLGRAVTAAADPATLVALATALGGHGDDDGIRRALTRAEGIAAAAADWLAIAEGWRDGGRPQRPETWDADRVRAALDAALAALDPDDPDDDLDARGAIAAGYRRWLDDSAAADRVGAATVPLDLPARRGLAGWRGDPRALFDALRAAAGADSLAALAAADHGMVADKHAAALGELVRTGQIPRPLDWYPREVLELVRWSVGDDVDHVGRGLACVVLVLAADPGDDTNASLAPLLESAAALGLDAPLEALLVWLAERREGAGPRLWALFGLLLARVVVDPDDARLPALRAELDALEAEAFAAAFGDGRPRPWLLRTAPYDDLRHDLWRALVEERLAPDDPIRQRLTAR